MKSEPILSQPTFIDLRIMAQFPFLQSLEITGFRAFSSLRIPRLGRVNLIVGKNNVGKSTLLEALRLYASNNPLAVSSNILEKRDEGRISRRDSNILQTLQKLFYRNGSANKRVIAIGPIDDKDLQLHIELGHANYKDEKAPLIEDSYLEAPTAVGVRRNGTLESISSLDSDFRYSFDNENESEPSKYHFVAASGLNDSDVARLWDNVSLSETEGEVVNALKLILPQLERVVMIGDTSEREGRRVAIARLAGNDTRIPLRTLGDGMNRLFGIVLALVNSSNGLLLIDEVENGLHWTVESNVWELLFQVSLSLNVQVFATTHSKDCIDAFEIAASENTATEGKLIRLERKGEQIQSVEFEESELAIAREHEIEIR